MDFTSRAGFSGNLRTKVIRAPKAPLRWRLANAFTRQYLKGRFFAWLAHQFSHFTGILTVHSTLSARLVKVDGSVVNYGIVSYRLVTTAFAEFAVDNLVADTTEWGDFKYHDSGVGTTPAAIGDTDIETTDGEARATGTQLEGASADIYRSVGTINYTTTKAITEHGLFSKATGTTLMDRHVFGAINVDNGDSIQFTYELTVDDGG